MNNYFHHTTYRFNLTQDGIVQTDPLCIIVFFTLINYTSENIQYKSLVGLGQGLFFGWGLDKFCEHYKVESKTFFIQCHTSIYNSPGLIKVICFSV